MVVVLSLPGKASPRSPSTQDGEWVLFFAANGCVLCFICFVEKRVMK